MVLLDKDLAILADGIIEGRRTFADTMKYVLMGASSNFGNMCSQGAASFILSFLPMLPKQILLNSLVDDSGEMTIPDRRRFQPRTRTARTAGKCLRKPPSPRTRPRH
jgi:Mg2+-importing ATPase